MQPACLLSAWIVALATVGDRPTADWPQFRGPTGQGISTARDVPVHWSTTDNIAWKTTIPGQGWSSPVLYAGRIYLTTAVAESEAADADRSLRAMCLDAATGHILWDEEIFFQSGETAASIHNKNSHASSTPLVADGRLYVHFGHQGTACLTLDGEVLWRNAELKYDPVHGNGGSPVLVDDALVFSCDGAERPFVAAIQRRDGAVRWLVERDVEVEKSFSFSTPLVLEVNGRTQAISAGSNIVAGYDPQSGREIWRVRYDGYSVVPRPIHAHGLVYVCTGYNTPELLAIRPDGQGDVTETHVEWRTARGAPNTPSLLAVGDELYMVSDRGVASCLDARNGQVHWQERIGGNFSASPVYAEGRIYLQDEEGTTTVIEAGQRFTRLARNALEEQSLATPAVTDGAIFIRTSSRLYGIGRP